MTHISFDVKYLLRGDHRLYSHVVMEPDEELARSKANALWQNPSVVEVQFLLNHQHMVGRKRRD